MSLHPFRAWCESGPLCQAPQHKPEPPGSEQPSSSLLGAAMEQLGGRRRFALILGIYLNSRQRTLSSERPVLPGWCLQSSLALRAKNLKFRGGQG